MQTLTSPSSTSATPVPPRRRRRRWPIVLAIVLVVLTGVLVIADRVAASIAEDQLVDVANDAMKRYDSKASDTTISVAGFPFITQALGGKFDGATVTMRDIGIGASEAESARVTLSEVKVPREVVFGEPA